jgi:hypothetical protein
VIEVPNAITSAVGEQHGQHDNPAVPPAVPPDPAVPDAGGQLDGAMPSGATNPAALPAHPNLPEKPANKDGDLIKDEKKPPPATGEAKQETGGG